MGEDITETLEVVPRQWKVIQTVREKFTCRECEKMVTMPKFAGLEFVKSGRRRRWSFEEKLQIVEESYRGQRLQTEVRVYGEHRFSLVFVIV